MKDAKVCPKGQMKISGKCKPITAHWISKAFENKGMQNKEVTKHRGKYHVLHICKNGVPVPVLITKDAEEVKDYVNTRYDLDI